MNAIVLFRVESTIERNCYYAPVIEVDSMAGTLDISASESIIENILSKNDRYTVPDYQRLYSWDEEQWDEFWMDLNNIEENDTHFLGSIVVIKHSGSYDELDKMELVDGQQRLTTISLLLCAMRDYYRETKDDRGLSDKIDNDYLHEDDLNNNTYPKLTLSKFDEGEFQGILDGNTSQAEGSQIHAGYEYFNEKIQRLSKDGVDLLRKRLLGSMTIVVIDCDDPESAFRLFETLNNRGLELSAVDLMKNSLLQTAMERVENGSEDEKYDHIREQWELILETVVREISKPDRFFRHYIMSSSEPEIDGSVSKYKLYDEFRQITRDRLPSENVTLKDYIDGMVDVSDTYVGFINADVDMFDPRSQKKINQRLQNLNDIKSVHTRTILLRTFQEFVDEPKKVDQILKLLEVFMTRWKLAGYPAGSKLDSIFSKLCSEGQCLVEVA